MELNDRFNTLPNESPSPQGLFSFLRVILSYESNKIIRQDMDLFSVFGAGVLWFLNIFSELDIEIILFDPIFHAVTQLL